MTERSALHHHRHPTQLSGTPHFGLSNHRVRALLLLKALVGLAVVLETCCLSESDECFIEQSDCKNNIVRGNFCKTGALPLIDHRSSFTVTNPSENAASHGQFKSRH